MQNAEFFFFLGDVLIADLYEFIVLYCSPFSKRSQQTCTSDASFMLFSVYEESWFYELFHNLFFFSEIIIETLQKTIKIFLQLFEVKPIISQKIQLTMSKYIVKLSFR